MSERELKQHEWVYRGAKFQVNPSLRDSYLSEGSVDAAAHMDEILALAARLADAEERVKSLEQDRAETMVVLRDTCDRLSTANRKIAPLERCVEALSALRSCLRDDPDVRIQTQSLPADVSLGRAMKLTDAALDAASAAVREGK